MVTPLLISQVYVCVQEFSICSFRVWAQVVRCGTRGTLRFVSFRGDILSTQNLVRLKIPI